MRVLQHQRLDVLESPLNRRVAQYWFELASECRPAWPDKAALDPLALGQTLSHLCLIDVRPDGGFTYRLVGEWVRALGVRRGQTVEDLENERGSLRICERLRRCVSAGAPYWDRYGYGRPAQEFMKIEALVLPLTALPGSELIDLLLTSGDFCKTETDSALDALEEAGSPRSAGI